MMIRVFVCVTLLFPQVYSNGTVVMENIRYNASDEYKCLARNEANRLDVWKTNFTVTGNIAHLWEKIMFISNNLNNCVSFFICCIL